MRLEGRLLGCAMLRAEHRRRQLAVRAVTVALAAAWAIGAAGCSSTNKTGGSSSGSGPAAAKFPGAQDPLLNSNIGQPPTPPPGLSATPTSATKPDSMLAGTVIDAFNRPVTNAYVRWVSLDERDAGGTNDTPTYPEGYFTILHLKPGVKYKLIARAKDGDKMMAGTVMTSAPDVRVVIRITENLVGADTPPLPGATTQDGKTPNAAERGPQQGAANTGMAPEPPSLPTTLMVHPPSTALPSDPPNAVKNLNDPPSASANPPLNRLPMLTVPSNPIPNPPTLPSPPIVTKEAKFDTGPTRVPSCVLIGNHLENMALKDSRGKTWEYKKDGAGKLVLIEFWGTHCIFCRETLPELEKLHKQYAARGLVVIGIALEAGENERRDIDAVNRFIAPMAVTYRQLLGRANSADAAKAFDLGKQFRIEGVPTLFLLNEQGDISFVHAGRPDPKLLEGLERSIQKRLVQRPN